MTPLPPDLTRGMCVAMGGRRWDATTTRKRQLICSGCRDRVGCPFRLDTAASRVRR